VEDQLHGCHGLILCHSGDQGSVVFREKHVTTEKTGLWFYPAFHEHRYKDHVFEENTTI
jgi:hypothetical protein